VPRCVVGSINFAKNCTALDKFPHVCANLNLSAHAACVVCGDRTREMVPSLGEHGHRQPGPHLATCRRCRRHLQQTECPHTGLETACAECGFVHAWIPDATYGQDVARLAASLERGSHDLTPLGVFFAGRALALLGADVDRGVQMLEFYNRAYIGQDPSPLPRMQLPLPGTKQDKKLRVFLFMSSSPPHFPLCFRETHEPN